MKKKANLGEATTRELLAELKARIEVFGELDYKTVETDKERKARQNLNLLRSEAMNNTQILRNIIKNLKSGRYDDAEDDCSLLPKKASEHIVGALHKCGETSAITVADKYLGQI